MKLILTIFLFLSCSIVYGQDGAEFRKKADSLYNIKEFSSAAPIYLQACSATNLRVLKIDNYYDAACSFSLAKDSSNAFKYLILAIKLGFNNLQHINEDSDLAWLKNDKRWPEIVSKVRPAYSNDPLSAKLVTSDIDLFWKVYDRYKKDTTNAASLFVSEYFEKGSLALQDYYRLKTPNIGGIKGFVHNMATMPDFYREIRENTLKVRLLTDTFKIIFSKLKDLYPGSSFPTTTFVIGGWSSGGTRTDYGAIVGCDMYSIDNNTSLNELNAWQKGNVKPLNSMKYVVAHELIHAQQDKMAGDTILLRDAIIEGMADFLGELISGKTANERLFIWAKGKEKAIWADFKKEMYLNRYSNWIANSKQERPDHPADLGYWVGYQICKSYFDEASDKKQAVYDMLHIQDYKKFLTDSKFDDKVKNL